jgi:uncharacterized membrane protein YesL
MTAFWFGTLTGAGVGGFAAWHAAMMTVRFDRARRGWKRKV